MSNSIKMPIGVIFSEKNAIVEIEEDDYILNAWFIDNHVVVYEVNSNNYPSTTLFVYEPMEFMSELLTIYEENPNYITHDKLSDTIENKIKLYKK